MASANTPNMMLTMISLKVSGDDCAGLEFSMRLSFKAAIWYGAMVHARLRFREGISAKDQASGMRG